MILAGKEGHKWHDYNDDVNVMSSEVRSKS